MIIQTVFTYSDGSRVLWDTESQTYLVKAKQFNKLKDKDNE